MSRPFCTSDCLGSEKGSSAEFGRDEGVVGYAMLAGDHQDDMTVEQIAERSVRIQMIVNNRFDIDPEVATRAVVSELETDIQVGDGQT